MLSIRIILVYVFFLVTTISFCQIRRDGKIDPNDILEWKTENIEDYSGVYLFGYSEGESELRVIVTDSIICAQLFKHEWSESHAGWIPVFENFENVKIIRDKFCSGKSNGRFAIYDPKNGYSVGLIMEKPFSSWIHPPETEFGQRFPDKEIFLNGKYPECSIQLLKDEYLEQLDLEKLQIMRNEIFARYGYIFIPNGKMDIYFRQFNWYQPIYKNVDNFLTEIEKHNIGLIKKMEVEKNRL